MEGDGSGAPGRPHKEEEALSCLQRGLSEDEYWPAAAGKWEVEGREQSGRTEGFIVCDHRIILMAQEIMSLKIVVTEL